MELPTHSSPGSTSHPLTEAKEREHLLLREAIADSLARGAVGVETSTIHDSARKLYEKHHFKQAFGDIGEIFLELEIDESSSSLLTQHRPQA